MVVHHLLSYCWAIFNTPVLLTLMTVVFLGSIGKSLSVRRAYTKVLLKIFEYGRQNIEDIRNLQQSNDSDSKVNNVDSESDAGGAGVRDDSTKAGQTDDAKVNGAIDTTTGITSTTDAAGSVDPLTDVADSRKGQPLNGFSSHEPYSSNSNLLISRDALILFPEGGNYNVGNNQIVDGGSSTNNTATLVKGSDNENSDSESDQTFDFHLGNCLDYIKAGVEAIIEDEVTSRFEAEELKNWNLLTRTNHYYEFISWRLSVIWVFGFFIRYMVLMPCRVIICFVGVLWLTICTAVVGCIPDSETKRHLVHAVLIQCFNFLSSALSAVINYHDVQNRPAQTGICVANHTSPIDVLVLMCDNCYSLIGQRHGGFLGVLQRALARASPHIWFERAESKDRLAVAQRLRSHVSDPANPPILIFPEGTCINNTSVMQFKKGSFEVGGVIYPVAIK